MSIGSNMRIFQGVRIRAALCVSVIILCFDLLYTQDENETQIAPITLGRIWTGVVANGDANRIDFSNGFFPNDYDILQHNGAINANFTGSGFRMAATNWKPPKGYRRSDGSIINDDTTRLSLAFFSPTNRDNLPNGKVIVPITNVMRYGYTKQRIDTKPINYPLSATINPAIAPYTYDQVVEVTSKNLLGVEVKRKVMIWSQSFNDNYIIIDVELTNTGPDSISGFPQPAADTLHNFYFWMAQGMEDNTYSQGNNPVLSSSETPKYRNVWQHYYGARKTDTARIFYFYHADDPKQGGDDMGSPVISQRGRLMNTNFVFYSILHASKKPYTSLANDSDDFTQPRVTYIGNENKIPNPSATEDEFGNRSYWAMRGGFSQQNLMDSTATFPGTLHMVNNDELGMPDFSAFAAGASDNNQTRNMSTFGPYEFPPGTKLRFVYAVGVAGIGIEKAKEIGEKWFEGTLLDPAGMAPNSTGRFPANFVFPTANDVDRAKNRWISLGIDSVHLAAFRAKWNFQRGYRIPQAPPPPDSIIVSGRPYQVEIRWTRNATTLLPSTFAGYRIQRRVSRVDTVFYETILDTDSAGYRGVSHSFIDTTVRLGAQTYYYVQTKWRISATNQNADPSTRGKIMYSNRTLVPNITATYPPGPAQGDLSLIRIVPNPYNINDPLLDEYGYGGKDEGRRHITFFNLPEKVTIKIFTENGDRIRTIYYDSPIKAGSTYWDMLTESQQTANSGIYIAVFEKPDGGVAFHKFIIVR